MQAAFLFPRVKPRRDELPREFINKWSTDIGADQANIVELENSRSKLCDELFSRQEEVVVVCGGTGPGPGNIVPQCLAEVADYEVPGIGEYLRSESAKTNGRALLGRGGCWVRGTTVMLAVPGGNSALTEQLGMVVEIIPDVLRAVRDECRSRSEKESS